MTRAPVVRVVADLGNSRLKWGRLDELGRLVEVVTLGVTDAGAWADAWHGWGLEGAETSSWAVASVNPPAAQRLAEFLGERRVDQTAWYRSAAEVPVRHVLETPETAG